MIFSSLRLWKRTRKIAAGPAGAYPGRPSRGVPVQLTFDPDVETFRAEFSAFLDAHLPDEAETVERSRSCSHVPAWARRWQRLLFDNGWLLPGHQIGRAPCRER